MSPVREAKGRWFTREYMADREWMTEYTAPEREWYLLTAMYSDDAGYLPWDLPDNAANLYRYESPARREKRVLGYVSHFAASGRFQDLGCGHALMPSVGKHPRGRTHEYGVRSLHAGCTGSAVEVQSSALSTVPLPVPLPDRTSRARGNGSKKEQRTTERTTAVEPGSLAALTGLDPVTLKASATP
jgi:hypothetical protein